MGQISVEKSASPGSDLSGNQHGYALLWRRYRSGYLFGIGEVVRGAVGRPHLTQTLRDLPEIRLWIGVYAGWAVALAALVALPFPALLATVLALVLLPVAALSLRYRSAALGLYAFVSWNAHAVGLMLGFLRARRAPGGWIASEVAEGRPAAGAAVAPPPAPDRAAPGARPRWRSCSA